jgi:hypothetical protein
MQSTEPKKPEPLLITLLNYLITSYLLDACMWELKDTTVYRHKLKQALNAVWKELQPVIDRQLTLLDGTDDEAMWSMMEGMKDLTHELATVRPEQLVALMHILRKFKADPEGVMDLMEVKIIEPQEIQVEEVYHG